MRRSKAQGVTQWLPRVRLGEEANRLGSRNPRDAERGDNLLNGDEMKAETQSQSDPQDRDPEATTGRFPLALFVVAELLCTGVLAASVILWD